MRKITKLLCFLALVMGARNMQSQCTANISFNVGANGVVSFTGTPTPWNGTTNFFWTLPGSTTAGPSGPTAWNATGTYTANGTYTVYLVVINSSPACTVAATQTISVNTVTTTPPVCTLNVVYSATSPTACNGTATVTAPGNMCGPVTYTWSNGANTSTVGGLCAGTSYTVQASSVSGVNCCSLSTGVITLPACGNLNANFNWTQAAGGVVNFNNITTGAWGSPTNFWTFGDGNTSSSASPSHTYAANGTYSVKLKVVNSLSPYCADSAMFNIYVGSVCNINAGFSYSQNMNNLSFTNSSTGASGYTWNFGDGSFSGGVNPSHTYTALGTYTVLLTASTGSFCVDTAMTVVTISTLCPAANATFTLNPTGTPQYWTASPLFPANIAGATWWWGDGSTSNTLYTSHTYSAAGMYTICLSVTLTCGSTNFYCNTYSIYRSAEDQNIITVNVIDPNLATGIGQAAAENLEYSVSPNPNNGNFNLSINGLQTGPVKVSVYNLVGELVYSADETSKGSLSKDIQLNSAANGVYFIQVNSGNKISTKKVVVTRQ